MKTAICFYGLIGAKEDKNGQGQPLSVADAGRHNIINIINQNESDVFIHSWSKDSEADITDFYNPTNAIIENQEQFDFTQSYIFKRPRREWLKAMISPVASTRKWASEAFRAHSRWKSTQKAVRLALEHSEKNNFVYDAVMVTRLDVAFYTPLKMLNYDLTKFWASNWNDAHNEATGARLNFQNQNQNIGFLDFWFFSNARNMKKFANLFDTISHYSVSPHRSSMEHVKKLGMKYDYTHYRWQDYEMVRRKHYLSKK